MSANPTADDFDSLAAKLDSLELTDAESRILTGILERAASVDEDEVTGLAYAYDLKNAKAGQLLQALGVTGPQVKYGDITLKKGFIERQTGQG